MGRNDSEGRPNTKKIWLLSSRIKKEKDLCRHPANVCCDITWRKNSNNKLRWLEHTLRDVVGFSSKQENFLFREIAERYISEVSLARKRKLCLFSTFGSPAFVWLRRQFLAVGSPFLASIAPQPPFFVYFLPNDTGHLQCSLSVFRLETAPFFFLLLLTHCPPQLN